MVNAYDENCEDNAGVMIRCRRLSKVVTTAMDPGIV